MSANARFLIAALCLTSIVSAAQEVTRFDSFHIESDDLYWRYKYVFPGPADSLRREVVQMLKSKFFTFNVIRNEAGYNGEIKHYTVNCRRYGRKFATTPGIYWEGEWTGKFVVEVTDDAYQVTVYALYSEKMEKSQSYYRLDRITRGRFIDKVTKNERTSFRRSELSNVALMSSSLKDEFDIRRTVVPQEVD